MAPTKQHILLFVLVIARVGSIQVMFESVPFCNSTSGFFECNVRVRKINRTTAALNGNLVHRVDIGLSFYSSIEFHHSPLGNNQFNRYPMKIGPAQTCEFINNHWGNYYEYVAKYAPNVMKPKECPYSARQCDFNDWILDGKMAPPYVPTGLWKLVGKLWDPENQHSFEIHVLIKAYVDGYF